MESSTAIREASQITPDWKTNWLLAITYPASGEIQYAVKDRRHSDWNGCELRPLCLRRRGTRPSNPL